MRSTTETLYRHNILTYYVHYIAYCSLYVMGTGSVFQTFMLESGISEQRVTFYVSLMQIVQTVTMVLLSRVGERVKNVRHALAWTLSPFIPFFAVMLFLSVHSGMAVDRKYYLLTAISVVLNLSLGWMCLIVYKLPHQIMDLRDYGKVSGQAGMLAGVVCMLLSVGMTGLLGKFPYFFVMAGVAALGIAAAFLASALCYAFRPVPIEPLTAAGEKIRIWRYKPVYQLLLPNFARGFSAGIFNLVTVIGYNCGILDSAAAGVFALATQIASLSGCQVYAFLAHKGKTGRLLLIASVIFCVSAPLMTTGKNKPMFYIFYLIAYLVFVIINYALPVLVADRIDYNAMSQFTAVRMVLYTVGVAVGGAIVPQLLELLGATGTLLVSGVTLLPCGIGYWRFDRAAEKEIQ